MSPALMAYPSLPGRDPRLLDSDRCSNLDVAAFTAGRPPTAAAAAAASAADRRTTLSVFDKDGGGFSARNWKSNHVGVNLRFVSQSPSSPRRTVPLKKANLGLRAGVIGLPLHSASARQTSFLMKFCRKWKFANCVRVRCCFFYTHCIVV